ncbi:MAG: hypothetical protein HN348_03630 [Proteobacteria bacterium]|jgi:hypothetical protein|nr:hypothetical protein [Pseudomonadota bacterium]
MRTLATITLLATLGLWGCKKPVATEHLATAAQEGVTILNPSFTGFKGHQKRGTLGVGLIIENPVVDSIEISTIAVAAHSGGEERCGDKMNFGKTIASGDKIRIKLEFQCLYDELNYPLDLSATLVFRPPQGEAVTVEFLRENVKIRE